MGVKVRAAAALVGLALFGGCSPGGDTYTLYRNSVGNPQMRLHIASFDAAEGGVAGYNNENCNLAASLFQAQPGVKTRFWCEKGPYKR